MNSRLAVKPAEDIYYAIPKPEGGFAVFSQRADEVSEPLHFDFWKKILPEVQRIWGFLPHERALLVNCYAALPRGRVVKEYNYDKGYTGNYIIAHGGDVPVNQIKAFVLQDFGLLELSRMGRVKWEEDSHEKTDPEDENIFRRVVKMRKKAVKK